MSGVAVGECDRLRRPSDGAWSAAVGYVLVGSAPAAGGGLVALGIEVMEAFAERSGYALGDVFVDDEPGQRPAWEALVDAARRRRPIAVLTPDIDGLRVQGRELRALRDTLGRVTTAPLVAAGPAPHIDASLWGAMPGPGRSASTVRSRRVVPRERRERSL